MSWKSEEMLELNEENIKEVFGYCVVKKGEPLENARKVAFAPLASRHSFPALYFYVQKLEEKKNTIAFLLGQLLVVHLRNDSFPIGLGRLKYDKTRWTENNGFLCCLCYLAVGAGLFPVFESAEKKEQLFICSLSSQNALQKTISPSDPAFHEFCEDLEYHEMLPRLVAEKKAYYASPDWLLWKAGVLAAAATNHGKEFAEMLRIAQDRLEEFDTDEKMLQSLSKKAAEEMRATMELYAIKHYTECK